MSDENKNGDPPENDPEKKWSPYDDIEKDVDEKAGENLQPDTRRENELHKDIEEKITLENNISKLQERNEALEKETASLREDYKALSALCIEAKGASETLKSVSDSQLSLFRWCIGGVAAVAGFGLLYFSDHYSTALTSLKNQKSALAQSEKQLEDFKEALKQSMEGRSQQTNIRIDHQIAIINRRIDNILTKGAPDAPPPNESKNLVQKQLTE